MRPAEQIPAVMRHCHPVLGSQDRLGFFLGASIELLVMPSVSVLTILILQCATGLGERFIKSNVEEIYESWPRLLRMW